MKAATPAGVSVKDNKSSGKGSSNSGTSTRPSSTGTEEGQHGFPELVLDSFVVYFSSWMKELTFMARSLVPGWNFVMCNNSHLFLMQEMDLV